MSITQKIKKIFIAGILALLPIVVTVYLLYFLYNLVVSKASPIVKKIAHQYNYDFSEYIFQIGTFLLILLIIFIIGILKIICFFKNNGIIWHILRAHAITTNF